MDVREKLVELLNEVQETGVNEIPTGFCCITEYITNEEVASYLVGHGVRAQEWISVRDKLPEPKHEFDARNWYLVALSNGVVKELAYEFHNNSVFGYGWRETAYPVTHWMPLPEPPKGE